MQKKVFLMRHGYTDYLEEVRDTFPYLWKRFISGNERFSSCEFEINTDDEFYQRTLDLKLDKDSLQKLSNSISRLRSLLDKKIPVRIIHSHRKRAFDTARILRSELEINGFNVIDFLKDMRLAFQYTLSKEPDDLNKVNEDPRFCHERTIEVILDEYNYQKAVSIIVAHTENFEGFIPKVDSRDVIECTQFIEVPCDIDIA